LYFEYSTGVIKTRACLTVINWCWHPAISISSCWMVVCICIGWQALVYFYRL
jgi:hypothetical protein